MKDSNYFSYNEYRADPPLDQNNPPSVGRIKWARNLFNKMDEPMKILRTRDCVFEHKNAQLCVKFYNYMAGVLVHYELLQHKAWFEYAEQVNLQILISFNLLINKLSGEK